MRTRRVLAAAAAAAVLASCGGPSTEKPSTQTVTSTITPESLSSETAPSPSPPPSPRAGAAAPPPAQGSAVADVIDWIQAGAPVDPNGYRTVRDPRDTSPRSTDIGPGVAFQSPTKKISCVGGLAEGGDKSGAPPLSCLVGLQNPPPRPEEPGQWIGGWVDYSGNAASVGSFHGDPGVFRDGDGAELAYGRHLRFRGGLDEYDCRMDQSGLWCADKAKGSAVLINDQGVTPYGCLRQIPHRHGEGFSYIC
jgi:hypothetical protein